MAALCPVHGANFWRILQLWAHINVEIPFNWPHGKSYLCIFQRASNCQSRMEMRSSDMNSFPLFLDANNVSQHLESCELLLQLHI